jgi:carboxymethylenebutenolidase
LRYNKQMTKIILALALAASTVVAQDWAKANLEKSPRHREWVTVKHDGRSVEAYVAYPESKDKTPVIVVIHEIFGMSDWVQEVTDEFAAAGYIAIAPDLLSGTAPGGKGTSGFKSDEVGKAIRDLNADQITADLNAVADYALKLPAAQKKLFVTGFCYGGGQSFRFATNRPDLAAAFVFYGGPPEKDAMAKIKTPVYGFYAGNDARIDATIPATVDQMKEAGKKYEPVTYEGAGHGFMRAGEAPQASEANVKARDEAWARLKQIMAH